MVGRGGKSTGADVAPAPNGDPDPAGRGEYDPVTGISDWYEGGSQASAGDGYTLTQIWAYRDLIEADLHAEYGIDADLADPDESPSLTGHSWRWLLVRIRGLLDVPGTRLAIALTPDPHPKA